MQDNTPANLYYWKDSKYFQSWYSICLAEDLAPGQVLGRNFLGTRIVIYRDKSGAPVVQGAYCPHLGADLSLGAVVDGQIQCPYHKWEFASDGICARVPNLSNPPRSAKLINYPVAESWGIIWAFNGEVPLCPVPSLLDVTEEDVVFKVRERDHDQGVDAWIVSSNAVDFQHLMTVHGFPEAITKPDVSVDEFSLSYDFEVFGRKGRGCIYGHNSFSMTNLTPFPYEHWSLNTSTSPQPGVSRHIYVTAVRKSDDPAKAAIVEEQLQQWADTVERVYQEDEMILETARFRRFGDAKLVRNDEALSKFYGYIDRLPRQVPISFA